jgi:hypothetical protein
MDSTSLIRSALGPTIYYLGRSMTQNDVEAKLKISLWLTAASKKISKVVNGINRR